MSIELLEQAAESLGSLREKVAFLGGAALVLWITDPGAPPPRPTEDVDVIVEVGSTLEYYRLGDELRERSFEEDAGREQICAWRHRPSGLKLDVMPTEPSILGFSNTWYPAALEAGVDVALPSETVITAVPPEFLLATKIEAFSGRGDSDFLGSRDFGDIVTLVDGRSELVAEVKGAPSELRIYLSAQLANMHQDVFFESGLAGALLPDLASQSRRQLVLERIQEIIAMGEAD